jgi:hypothetical protein
MATSLGSRMAYNKAVEAINRAGFSAGQAVLSQGYLRTEQILTTGRTTYTFPILQNDSSQGTIVNTENRLPLQDAFYVSSLGVFLAKTGTSSILQTYPDPLEFAGAGDAAALGTIYNSSLSITTNNRQIVPFYDLTRHYFVPQTQASTSGYFSTGTAQKNQVDLSTNGFYPIEPGWVLVGSKNNQIQVTLPAAMSLTTQTYRLILVFRGHQAQNVTPVR